LLAPFSLFPSTSISFFYALASVATYTSH
jgi:hypothetical protein